MLLDLEITVEKSSANSTLINGTLIINSVNQILLLRLGLGAVGVATKTPTNSK